jgi:methylmalonyl-CoA mutase
MQNDKDLFSEFSPVSKAEWLARMEKDLKGKPLEDLYWRLEEDIVLAPFYHPEDLSTLPAPITRGRADNNWEIGELIVANDAARANAELLEGLAGGVEAPLLIHPHEPAPQELEDLLRDVQLDIVSTHYTFVIPEPPVWKLLEQLGQLFEKRGHDPAAISGSVDFDPILDWGEPPYDILADTLRASAETLPRFRCLQVNGLRFHAGPDNSTRELAYILAKGSEYLAQLGQRGIAPKQAAAQMQFTISLSASYFVEIAKLRAFRLLWAKVAKAYDAGDHAALIIGHLAHETQTEDIHANMIRAGSQAMSAIIGGVDRLYVRPADFSLQRPGDSFTRRIARNVQHLLREESYLHRVIDPAAGSYFVETLTNMLAREAWRQFKVMEERGEFR